MYVTDGLPTVALHDTRNFCPHDCVYFILAICMTLVRPLPITKTSCCCNALRRWRTDRTIKWELVTRVARASRWPREKSGYRVVSCESCARAWAKGKIIQTSCCNNALRRWRTTDHVCDIIVDDRRRHRTIYRSVNENSWLASRVLLVVVLLLVVVVIVVVRTSVLFLIHSRSNRVSHVFLTDARSLAAFFSSSFAPFSLTWGNFRLQRVRVGTIP